MSDHASTAFPATDSTDSQGDQPATITAEQPEMDASYDQPEILHRWYLETAEEAQALHRAVKPAAEASSFMTEEFGEESEEHTTRSRRSRREGAPRDEAQAKRVAKAHFRAKLIIWGAFFSLILAVFAAATYKIPILFHEHFDSPRMWPWTWILGEYKAPEADTIEDHVYALKAGGNIDQATHDKILRNGEGGLKVASRLFADAKKAYESASEEGVEEAARVDRIREAVELAKEAIDQLELILPKLEQNDGPPKINRVLKEAQELRDQVAPKRFNWKKELPAI